MSTSPGTIAPRWRSRRAESAILESTIALLAELGFGGLTIDGIAARAGVGKATIYRRYDCKLDLVRDALYWSAQFKPTPDTGTLRGDLDGLLTNLDKLVHDPVLGPSLHHMTADGARHPELRAVYDQFLQHRREGTKTVLRRAIERGELRPDAELELATDVLTGPVMLRHLSTHMPIDRAFLAGVRDAFLRLYGT